MRGAARVRREAAAADGMDVMSRASIGAGCSYTVSWDLPLLLCAQACSRHAVPADRAGSIRWFNACAQALCRLLSEVASSAQL
jgi:hypothetical protein